MIYESDGDRHNEECCAWILENVGFEAQVTKTVTHYDIKLKRNGKPYALVEYKHRKKQYSTLKIDQSKIDNLIDLSVKYEVKPILIIEWADVGGYWWWQCSKDTPLSTMTRTKRRGIAGETPETEDVVYEIPTTSFTQI